jgi:endoglucanase
MTTPKIILVLAVIFLVSNCSSDDHNTTAPEKKTEPALAWLKTEGNKIVDDSGKVMILRGVNRSGFEYDKKGNGISEEEVEFIINEWKAQIIRLPFNQDWMTNDQSYANYFDRIIGWVASRGAYALLDLQWENTEVQIPTIPNEAAIDMWKKIAQKYKENPAVLYDIENEAHDTTWELWRARASQIIEAIQQVHPKALIFVSGLDWAYDLRGWEEQPLPYSNIVYSTHPYPFKGEPWAWDKYFGNFSAHYPVFAGEFGGETNDLNWGNRLLGYFDSKQLGWTAWSWVDQPRLTQSDRRTPTDFGRLVKAALVKHAGGGE